MVRSRWFSVFSAVLLSVFLFSSPQAFCEGITFTLTEFDELKAICNSLKSFNELNLIQLDELRTESESLREMNEQKEIVISDLRKSLQKQKEDSLKLRIEYGAIGFSVGMVSGIIIYHLLKPK